MTRERSHKGSGRPRKRPTIHKDRNDRRQEPGTDTQVLREEEEREGEKLGENARQGERAEPR